MILLPLFVLALTIGSIGSASQAFNYSITQTLTNNGNYSLAPGLPSSPYYQLLNQNVFLNDSRQTSVLASVTMNGLPVAWQMSNDSDGNPVIQVMENGSLTPGASATLALSFEIHLQQPTINLSGIENISEIPASLVQQYPLTGTWNLTNMGTEGQSIVSTALAIKGSDNNTLSVVYRLLQWFEDNMVYNDSLPYPQQVSQTFATLSGKCDDQADLFIMFCRILGIPAYLSIGPIYIPGSSVETDNNIQVILTNMGWHGWAMVYLPTQSGGEWVPVDLTYFSGETSEGGHLLSQNLEQHITSSAFASFSTVQYASFNTIDYVGESNAQRDILVGSNITWTESHIMIPLQPATSAPSWYPALDVYALVATAAAVVLFLAYAVRWRALHKTPSG